MAGVSTFLVHAHSTQSLPQHSANQGCASSILRVVQQPPSRIESIDQDYATELALCQRLRVLDQQVFAAISARRNHGEDCRDPKARAATSDKTLGQKVLPTVAGG
jgi:hypothetical protein